MTWLPRLLGALRTPRGTTWASMAGAAAVAAIWFGAAAGHGVDGHHQGFVARTAIDVASGRALFTETFTHYGPVHAYLNAAGLELLGERLLSIQYVTVLAYALASAALWRFWHLLGGAVAAWMGVAAFWVSAPEVVRDRVRYEGGQPTWISELAMHPWPSAWALAFTAIGFTAFLVALRSERPTRPALVSGVATGLAIGTRFPSGLTALAGLLIAAGVWRLLTGRPVARQSGLVATGAVGGAVLAYSPALVRGGAADAWDQTVSAPREWASGLIGDSISFALDRFADALPFAAALCVVSLSVALIHRQSARRWAPMLGWGLLVLAVVAALRGSFAAWPIPGRILRGQGHWKGAVLSLSLVAVAGGILAGLLAVRERISSRTGAPPREDLSYPTLLVGALVASTSLVQIVPVVEERHIWWSTAPLLGVGFAALLMPLRRSAAVGAVAVSVAFVPLLAAGLLGYHARQSGPWVGFGGGPFMTGMEIRPAFAGEVRPLVRAVDAARAARPEVVVVALAHDSLYGLLGGRMDPPDRYAAIALTKVDTPSLARFIKKEHPVLWLENTPEELVEPYADSVGYCVEALHRPTGELPMLRVVMIPCPGPDREGPLTWRSVDGPAPPWAERVV